MVKKNFKIIVIVILLILLGFLLLGNKIIQHLFSDQQKTSNSEQAQQLRSDAIALANFISMIRLSNLAPADITEAVKLCDGMKYLKNDCYLEYVYMMQSLKYKTDKEICKKIAVGRTDFPAKNAIRIFQELYYNRSSEIENTEIAYTKERKEEERKTKNECFGLT